MQINVRDQFENYWYEANQFSQSEHAGTHTDSPSHFAKGKWRTHDIPLHRLSGPAVVVDIRNANYIPQPNRIEH